MPEENITQELRLKDIDKTTNYLIEEINRNELMSKKHKKVCTTLNYTEHFISASAIILCVSIFAFASLVDIPIRITKSVTGLNICAITARIKKYKSIITIISQKRKKKHDKKVLLAKSYHRRLKFLRLESIQLSVMMNFF